VVDELLDDDVVAGVDELDGRRTDKNVSSQSESSEGANILSRGSSRADSDVVPPPGVCRPGFAGVVEVLRPPFFKDMGHCCGNSSLGKHVSIFLETSVLYEEIVSVVFLGREILLVRIPVC